MSNRSFIATALLFMNIGVAIAENSEVDTVKAAKEAVMKPKDIRTLKQLYFDGRKATLEHDKYPVPKSGRVVVLDFSSKASPPVIRIAQNQGCSLSFVDVDGKAWPFLKFINHSESLFKVEQPIEKTSVLAITAKDLAGVGNFAAYIQSPRDKNTVIPVVFTVLINQSETDYKVDAVIPVSDRGEQSVNSESYDGAIEAVMAGSSLSNMRPMVSSDARVSAWLKISASGNTVILRTRSVILAPAPITGKKMIGSDGTNVYEIKKTNVISLAEDGDPYRVTLTEKSSDHGK